MKKNKFIKNDDAFSKFSLFLLILIFVIVICLLIYEISIMDDGKLDKNSALSKSDVIDLLEKGSKYPNYYASIQEKSLFFKNKSQQEYYIKDNIETHYVNSKIVSWTNYNTNESIAFNDNVAKSSEISEEDKKYSQNNFNYSNIVHANSSKNSEDSIGYSTYYKYLGKTNINGRDEIVIQILDKNDTDVNTKYIIDVNTGLIQKEICYCCTGILMLRVDISATIDLNCVTDTNIAKPDLSIY